MNSGNDLKPSGCQEFTYVGEASDARHNRLGQRELPLEVLENFFSARVFPLSTRRVGDRVRIVSLDCDESNNRLMGMGFIPGVVLEVISCTATGSVIVALQDAFGSSSGSQRLGLGAEMAQRIQVIDTDQPLNAIETPITAKMATMQTPEVSTVKLRHVALGSILRVIGYAPTARDYKRKLLAMGLTPGTELLVKRHAPLGDPTEIEVRGFRLSLRKDEADALRVELISGGES